MKRIPILAGIIWILLFAPWAAAQSLVYMVSYTLTPAGFRAHFPNGTLGATPDQRLATLRRNIKNEIWSVSMADGKRTLLFSDEGMSNFELLPGYPTVASGKALVKGVERSWRGQPNPGAMETPQGVYESSLDGTKRFRRLIDVKPNMASIMLNLAGTSAAIESQDPATGKYTLDVYGLPDWKLVRSLELNKAFEAHCPGCLVQSYGWLADGKALFFELDPGDEDGGEASPNQVPGNYIVSEEGADLGSIPRTAGRMETVGYERLPSFDTRLIGQLGDGRFVFLDYALKKVPRPKPPVEYEPFLVITDRDFKVLKQLQIGRLRTSGYVLSANGKYVAFVEDRQIPNYKTERHVWAKNLEAGEAKEVFMTPPPNPPTSAEPNVSVTIIGWLEK